MSFRILAAALMLFAAALSPAVAALADELGEVTRLHHAGQTEAALVRADKTLATTPKDAQMRFLKSVILADTGRTGEAQTLLQQLVQDYPELAEPHNNLAALYAANGDYGRSRSELEETLRLKPGYAPAQENLGDVHILLAAQSYAKALRLEPSSATLPRKLAMARQIVAAPGDPAPKPSEAARPASAAKR
jgi:Flp pilus assembly protein TadD